MPEATYYYYSTVLRQKPKRRTSAVNHSTAGSFSITYGRNASAYAMNGCCVSGSRSVPAYADSTIAAPLMRVE